MSLAQLLMPEPDLNVHEALLKVGDANQQTLELAGH